MLKIEKVVTPSWEQWEIVIEGMRNPKNSWDKSVNQRVFLFFYYFLIGEVLTHKLIFIQKKCIIFAPLNLNDVGTYVRNVKQI